MGYYIYEAALEEPDDARKQELLDEATFYLDRSLKIYPTYRDALNVYAGVLSSRYDLDGKIDALLDGFFQILTSNRPTQFDNFLNWLNYRQEHQEELANFYFRVGYEHYFQKLKNDAEAARYLGFGYRVAPDNMLILEALGDVWLARGNADNTLRTRRDAHMALKYAGEGIELDPAYRRFYEIAAEAYERLGDPTNADLMRRRAPRTNSP
jgi:tetratricopeptide (TPR) repeat protein